MTYASCPDTRCSVTGGSVFLKKAPVVCLSQGQKFVLLSVRESKVNAMTVMVQYMLYVMHLLQSLKLNVEFPMVAETDNAGLLDLINNWSVAGRTHHVDTRKTF